jgi:hypothetical protein
MLADVRPLRQLGKRIDRERLRLVAPQRGHLAVKLMPDHWRMRPFSMATLSRPHGDFTYLLPPLCHVEVRRWRGADLVLIGMEQVQQRRITTEYPQAWWVQLLGDPGRLEIPPPAPAG